MSTKGYTYFVLKNPLQANYGFTGYTDKEGRSCFIPRGEDDRGNLIKRKFTFGRRRQISIPNSQKEVIDFLRNHPNCEGSENGFYVVDSTGKQVQKRIDFVELNHEKDAKVATDAVELRHKAESIAIGLKDNEEELRSVGINIGCNHDQSGMIYHYVLQFAENNPQKFLDIYEDPSRKAMSVVKEGLNKTNVLRKKGFMILWGDEHLGNDEQSAAKKLSDDPDLMKAIKDENQRVKNAKK